MMEGNEERGLAVYFRTGGWKKRAWEGEEAERVVGGRSMWEEGEMMNG